MNVINPCTTTQNQRVENVKVVATTASLMDEDVNGCDDDGEVSPSSVAGAAVDRDCMSNGSVAMVPICSSTSMAMTMPPPSPPPPLNLHLMSVEQQCLLIDRLLPSLTRTALTHAARECDRLSRVDFIGELPAELSQRIMNYLDISTYTKLILVCRLWASIIQPPWIVACQRYGLTVLPDDPSYTIWRLLRYSRRKRQFANAFTVRYLESASDLLVRPVAFDLEVAHPYFVVHIPAASSLYTLHSGHVLIKQRQNSATLNIYADATDGSMFFVHTGIEGGPSAITALDAQRLVMAFPCGSIQLWEWRQQRLIYHAPKVAATMGRCVDYAPLWDLAAVGGNDGAIALIRLSKSQLLHIVREPDTVTCPVINLRLLTRSQSQPTNGMLTIRVFVGVTHQTEQTPIVFSTAICAFACVRIYEMQASVDGTVFCQPILVQRTEPYSIGAKTTLQLNKSAGTFAYLTADYSQSDVYLGDTSYKVHIHEFDPCTSILTTGACVYNPNVCNMVMPDNVRTSPPSSAAARRRQQTAQAMAQKRAAAQSPSSTSSGMFSPAVALSMRAVVNGNGGGNAAALACISESGVYTDTSAGGFVDQWTTTSVLVRDVDSPLHAAHKSQLSSHKQTEMVAKISLNLSSNMADTNESRKVSRAQKRRETKDAAARRLQSQINEDKVLEVGSARQIESGRIAAKCTARNLRVHDVPSDGDCLYNAVAHQMKIIDQTRTYTSAQMRSAAADYMLLHRDDFAPFLTDPKTGDALTDDELTRYCECDVRGTTTPPVWGGQVELRALCQSLRRRVRVIQADADDLLFEPDNSHVDDNQLVITYHRHVYASGEHYNSTITVGSIQ